MFVKGSGKPAEILTKLNVMAGFALDEEIELFEVSFWNYYVKYESLLYSLYHFCTCILLIHICCMGLLKTKF